MPCRSFPRNLRRSLTCLAAALLGAAPGLAHAQRIVGVTARAQAPLAMQVAADARLTWVRLPLDWSQIESTPGKLDWSATDAAVAAAQARGVKLVAAIQKTPAWASQGDALGDGPANDLPVASAHAAFVAQAVARYQSSIAHYELGDAPNTPAGFEGSGQQFLDLVLAPGAAAVRASCASCQVLAPGFEGASADQLPWLEGLLAQGSNSIDLLSVHLSHPFAGEAPSPPEGDSFVDRIDALKAAMDRQKFARPLWVTATGRDGVFGDPAAEQAQQVRARRVLETMLPRSFWGATFFQDTLDVPTAPDLAGGLALADPADPRGYRPKAIHGFLAQAVGNQLVFGGTGNDCMDLLDNDNDGAIDAPADQGCAGGSVSEGTGLRSDLDLAEHKASDDGCQQGRGASAGGWLVLALAVLARRRRA